MDNSPASGRVDPEDSLYYEIDPIESSQESYTLSVDVDHFAPAARFVLRVLGTEPKAPTEPNPPKKNRSKKGKAKDKAEIEEEPPPRPPRVLRPEETVIIEAAAQPGQIRLSASTMINTAQAVIPGHFEAGNSQDIRLAVHMRGVLSAANFSVEPTFDRAYIESEEGILNMRASSPQKGVVHVVGFTLFDRRHYGAGLDEVGFVQRARIKSEHLRKAWGLLSRTAKSPAPSYVAWAGSRGLTTENSPIMVRIQGGRAVFTVADGVRIARYEADLEEPTEQTWATVLQPSSFELASGLKNIVTVGDADVQLSGVPQSGQTRVSFVDGAGRLVRCAAFPPLGIEDALEARIGRHKVVATATVDARGLYNAVRVVADYVGGQWSLNRNIVDTYLHVSQTHKRVSLAAGDDPEYLLGRAAGIDRPEGTYSEASAEECDGDMGVFIDAAYLRFAAKSYEGAGRLVLQIVDTADYSKAVQGSSQNPQNVEASSEEPSVQPSYIVYITPAEQGQGRRSFYSQVVMSRYA